MKSDFPEKIGMDAELLKYLEGFVSARRLERFKTVLEKRTRYITVALEDVYQMHNASAVVRSCDVFGLQEAHLIEARYGHRLDKNIAMGAQRWVDIQRHSTTRGCVDTLRARGYRIVATSPHQKSYTPETFPLDQPLALFMGTEKEGLSEELLGLADATIHVPMVGFTESLNISVAAAILLHHLTGRLRASDRPWQLTEDDKRAKRWDWARKTVKSADEILARYLERS